MENAIAGIATAFDQRRVEGRTPKLTAMPRKKIISMAKSERKSSSAGARIFWEVIMGDPYFNLTRMDQ